MHIERQIALRQIFRKSFRRRIVGKCNRDYILKGCALLGMDVKEVAEICIEGMREHAAEIGLAGNAG